MVRYVNSSASGAIESAEFSPMAGGNMAFLQLRDADHLAKVKTALAEINQQVVAESNIAGKPILVTRGEHDQAKLLALLGQKGESLAPKERKRTYEPWVIRSLLGFGGQGLQLWSSFLRPMGQGVTSKGIFAHVDTGVFVFAAANLTANAINLIYRAQDLPDPHRLNYVKQQVNDKLAPQMDPSQTVIDTRDDRMVLRDPEYHTRRALTGFHGFMQRHSVNVGELGLRYIGAFGLAYPWTMDGKNNWSNALHGKMPTRNSSPWRAYAGLSSIAGKTVALTSKVPDPYNPKGTSWLDSIREKFSFKLGGWIETVAFAALAFDNFFHTDPKDLRNKNHTRSIVFRGKPQSRDWIGGIGASMFVAGYIVRHWAKYGQRHVDMQEIYAHTGDTLAKLPPEKVPQALADISAKLADQFKDDPALSYGTIYNQLAADLCRYHHLSAQAAHIPEPPPQPDPNGKDDKPAAQVQAGDSTHIPPHTSVREAAHG